MIESYCDGSCLDNQSKENRRAGAGYVIVEDDERIHEESSHVGDGENVSNNVAEYEAAIESVKWRNENRPDEPITIHTDSQLIVKQTEGDWSCNENHLFTRVMKLRGLMEDDDQMERISKSKHIARAHDLAQAGASDTEPPEKSSGTKRRRSSGSGKTEITHIDPEILDELPERVEKPHDGIEPSNIPDELKRRVQWLVWEVGMRDGNETKMPKQADDPYAFAQANNEDTWSDFATAVKTAKQNRCGIGFVLATGDPYVAIDLDDCRDPQTMEIEDWAMEIIEDLDSYAQVSVSNTGAHVFVKADGVPDDWTNKKEGPHEVEVYEWGRFITMTGHRIGDSPQEIRRIDDFDDYLMELDDRL